MRKIISILIVLCLTLSIIPSGAMELTTLSDINEHWAEDEIQTLYDIGILNGNGVQANPDDTITRGEFTALVTRSVYDMDEYDGKKYFDDIPEGDVFFDNISLAYEKGIIKGKDEGYFDRNGNITREEMVIIISRMLDGKSANNTASFSDIKKDYTYANELKKVVGLGIINGYNDNTFRPYLNATRAESTSILVRFLKVHGNSPSGGDIKHLENYNYTYEYAIGTERKELEYKENINALMNDYSISVTKDFNLVSSNAEFLGNNLAVINQVYDANYNINYKNTAKAKNYSAYRTLYLFRKNGEWKVYRSDLRLAINNPINLTWEIYKKAPDYVPEGVNIVSPTWFELNSKGEYKSSPRVYSHGGTTINFSDNATESYLDYADENGFEIWAMYRTDFQTDTANKFLNSVSSRQKAIMHLIDRVSRYALDGINMDFEHMYHTDAAAYTSHVREVTLAMHECGLVTSVDVTKYEKTSLVWSMCFDRDALAKSTDYMCLMAYDQHSSGSKTAGPVAGLSWVEGCITSLLKEADASQIILGVPFYVRMWKTENGKVVSSKALSMADAQKTANDNNANLTYLAEDGQNVATWNIGRHEYKMWMENADSIEGKMKLKEKYNLAGVASWRRGFETLDVWQVIDKYM